MRKAAHILYTRNTYFFINFFSMSIIALRQKATRKKGILGICYVSYSNKYIGGYVCYLCAWILFWYSSQFPLYIYINVLNFLCLKYNVFSGMFVHIDTHTFSIIKISGIFVFEYSKLKFSIRVYM